MIFISSEGFFVEKFFIVTLIFSLFLISGQPTTSLDNNNLNNLTIQNFKSKTRIVLDFYFIPKSYYLKAINSNSTILTVENSNLPENFNSEFNLSDNQNAIFSTDNDNLLVKFNVKTEQLAVATMDNPSRIIIDVTKDKQPTQKTFRTTKLKNEIYPGVKHTQTLLKGPAFVNIVDIDLNNPALELTPVSASDKTLFAKKNINNLVNSNNAIAGINASFFKPPNGLPVGTLIINKEIYTGPLFNRVSLVIDEDNHAYLDKLSFNGYAILEDLTVLKFQNINQPRMSTKDYMIYSDKWTTLVPHSLKNELQIAVLGNQVTQTTTGQLKVPQGGYVITGPNHDRFKQIAVNDKIGITLTYLSKFPNIKHAVGGGPCLIKDGEIYVDTKEQKFNLAGNIKDPRTAVAITKNNHILFVTVDGRQKGSAGIGFYQLAKYLKSLGAMQAMNFDGGSSTQMSVKGKIVNKPTVRGGALVSTGIIVKQQDSYTIASSEP